MQKLDYYKKICLKIISPFLSNIRETLMPREMEYFENLGKSRLDYPIKELAENSTIYDLRIILTFYIKGLDVEKVKVSSDDLETKRAEAYVPIILTQIENKKSQTLTRLALLVALVALCI